MEQRNSCSGGVNGCGFRLAGAANYQTNSGWLETKLLHNRSIAQYSVHTIEYTGSVVTVFIYTVSD
jgi:hypothetical protein